MKSSTSPVYEVRTRKSSNDDCCHLLRFFIDDMNNRIIATFLLTLLVVIGLSALYYLPVLQWGDVKLRKVDLLSDVRIRKETAIVADSDTVALPVIKPAFVDTCMSGMTCIEDFSDSTMRGMTHFYEHLGKIEKLRRPVRIAYFGDSYIEADILTADLREMFQKRFGGCGVGYVPVFNPISGFRPTVHHKYEGWRKHAVTDTIGFHKEYQDLSNQYFIPASSASVTLSGQTKYASLLDTCQASSLFFRTTGNMKVTAQVNGFQTKEFLVSGKEQVQSLTVKGKIGKVKWSVAEMDSAAYFYGVTMDPLKGIILDNFSVRGSSGKQLGGIPAAVFSKYDAIRQYDLVVLQYGLNVAHASVSNYDYYTRLMVPVVERIKRLFPNSSILIVGVGDREIKDEYGELSTMPAVKNLIRYQKKLAFETKVAFWNMFEAMGGEGSIVSLVNSNPPKANLDYTHINFRGGKHLAQILFRTLMYGKKQYDKRKAYEQQ